MGVAPEDLLLAPESSDADRSLTLATLGWDVGHCYLVMGTRERGVKIFEQIVAGTGWSSFGHIAAEADLARLNSEADR